jgi:hypothetical protein
MSATKLLVLGIVHLSGGAHGYQVRSELQMASSPNTPSRAIPGRSAFCTARQLGDVTR